MPASAPWAHVAGLLAAMVLFGGSFVATKIALTGFSPMATACLRMVLASLVLLPAARRLKEHYRPGDGRLLLMMGFFEPCLYFVCESYALKYGSASQAGMLTATLPVFVAAGARFTLGERSSGRVWAGFALAIGGAALLTLLAQESSHAPAPLLGGVLEVLAMLCATGGILSVKALSARYPAILLTAVQAFVGVAFFLPVMLLTPDAAPTAWPLTPSLAVIYLGFFVTVLAYGLYNWGMSRLPASRASAYVNLVPVFALACGALILGDRFTPGQYAASLLVFAGVWLSQSAGRAGG